MSRERQVAWCIALVFGLLLSACGGTVESEAPGGTDGLTEETPEHPQPYLAASPGPGGPVGIVLETMNASGYTYARIGTGNTEIWVAAPTTELAIGDTVSLAGADNMGPFASPTLDRTFEQIYFIDQFRAPRDAGDTSRGTVLETMNVVGYTYVLVSTGGRPSSTALSEAEAPGLWLAGPETALTVGDAVSWQGGMVMREFHSGTLDRTFPEILFVESLTRAD